MKIFVTSDNKRSLVKIGDKNPMWKGDGVGYNGVHRWVRKIKPKPELCERCNKRKPSDLANKNGNYTRDPKEWEYLCRKCHMDGDGRSDQLRESGRSRRLPDKTCPNCNKVFHRDDRKAVCCSLSCRSLLMWKKRKTNEDLRA